MRLNEMALAKAVAMVNAVVYVICFAWSKISVNSLIWLGNSWAHSVNLAAIPMKSPNLAMGLIGLFTWTAFVGLMTYFSAWFYNRMISR